MSSREVLRQENPLSYCLFTEIEKLALSGETNGRRAGNKVLDRCNHVSRELFGRDFNYVDPNTLLHVLTARDETLQGLLQAYPFFLKYAKPQTSTSIRVIDLQTVQQVTPSTSASVGDIVRFEITITNRSDGPANNVVLSDILPDNLTATPMSGTVDAGIYNDETGLWSLDELASAGQATLVLEGVVIEAARGQLIENITDAAMSDAQDTNQSGDSLTASVQVLD